MKLLWMRHNFMVTPLMCCNQLQLSTENTLSHLDTPHSAKGTTILIILHKLKTSESSLTLPFSSHTYLVSQHSCLCFLQNVVHVHFIPLPHCTRGPQHIMPKLFHCFHWSFPSRLQFNYSLISPENQHPACSACHARQGSISLSQLNFGT